MVRIMLFIGDRLLKPHRRSNQAMQPTAGRCTASPHIMKTRPLHVTLALASGD